MSGHLRCRFAGLVLLGNLTATPALSAPFSDLFHPAPREPAASSSARPECLAQPGNLPRPGQRWVYRRDGYSKCWFLAEGIATARKPSHNRISNRPLRSDENEIMPQRRSPVSDAHAELPSSAKADEPQPTPPSRQVKVTDADSVFDAGSPIRIPAAPLSDLPGGQLTAEHSVPSHVGAEKLSTGARADLSLVMPSAARDEQALVEVRSRAVTWLGVALMMLGGFSILSATRALRHVVRFRH